MIQYDIYLPLKYNDGKLIEPSKFNKTRHELVNKFGGLTVFPANLGIEGWWKFGNRVFRDEIKIFRVITQEDEEEFWKLYKKKLKQRFLQEEVFIVKTPISII